MNWTDLLKAEVESEYRTVRGLLSMVDEGSLRWKPSSGANWMTVGQLLEHLTESCGAAFRGFVTGDWGPPPSEAEGGGALPPAEKMPAASSVAQAMGRVDEDRALALRMLGQAGEGRLGSETAPAPWDPTPMLLGHRLLQMVWHLASHKSQLYYYLKLQGKPVNTSHLWGA